MLRTFVAFELHGSDLERTEVDSARGRPNCAPPFRAAIETLRVAMRPAPTFRWLALTPQSAVLPANLDPAEAASIQEVRHSALLDSKSLRSSPYIGLAAFTPECVASPFGALKFEFSNRQFARSGVR